MVLLDPWLVMKRGKYIGIDMEFRVSWLNRNNMQKQKKAVIGAFYIILSTCCYTHTVEEAKGGGRA